MKLSTTMQRWTATGLLATACFLTAAPAAQAGHGYGHRRFKGVARMSQAESNSRFVVREHSGAGPVLAGILGGFILGTAIAGQRQVVVHERECAPPPPQYRYYDPYCEEYMDDLDECRLHQRDHRHPRVVRVIEISSGDCVRDLRWSAGGWHDEDMDWDD